MSEIVIKYQSSKNELTERKISNIVPRVSDDGKKTINAYCHLRSMNRSFTLNNILEVYLDGEIIDKNKLWKDNINDKKEFVKNIENMLSKKKKEYEYFVALTTRVLEDIK